MLSFCFVMPTHARKIKLSNHFRGNRGKTCKLTVDGTDCPIVEPTPFSKIWYSHKFHGPGVRYEVAVCIQMGDICWIHGPFPCGKYNDLTIFRLGLKRRLQPGEMVEADKGYRGDGRCRVPGCAVSKADLQAMTRARSRHETVNNRLKMWACLERVFRHHRSKHGQVFRAVVTMTQLAFKNGEPPFQVRY